MRAAIYLGVPPWELIKQPRIWTNWAVTAMGAEGRAEKVRMERAKAKKK